MTLLLIHDLFLILNMLHACDSPASQRGKILLVQQSNESNVITEQVADQVAQGDSQRFPGVPRFLLVLQQIQPLCIAL